MKTCPKCGSRMDHGEACPRCLLGTGLGHEEQTKTERIFKIALSYDASERGAFVAQAAGNDTALREELEMLLEGYAEAGGDEAAATLGGTARSQWAAVRREEAGTVIDHFRLVMLIGEGGMGSVWEAEQTAPIRRRVALKIIKLGMDTEEVVRRFERERRTLALMTHPHIAQVFEAGSTPAGRPYFAMELVEGVAITAHCLEQRLSVKERLGIFLEVCAAVEVQPRYANLHNGRCAYSPDGRIFATGNLRGNIELIDLRPLLPEPDLDPQQLRLRAELDADAEVHPGGGLAPLTAQRWLEKWQQWRKAASAPGPGGP